MAVLHTTKVKSTNTGGRLFSVLHTEALRNGEFGFLGGYVEGETEIREFVKPTTALIGKEMPVVIMKPEIRYPQYTKADNALGLFVNPANKATVAVPLEANDEFEISADLITALGAKPVVGNHVVLENGKTLLKEQAGAPSNGAKFYGVITEVRPSATQPFVDGTGNYVSNVYDLVHILVKEL